MTIPFEKPRARLLADPTLKAAYDALAAEFEIAAELAMARLRAGLSQAELAARTGTSQSTIARRKRADAAQHQDPVALCRSDRQQLSRTPLGGLTGEAMIASD